jgi:glycyl-tRNA synthetase
MTVQTNEQLQDELDALNAQITKQGSAVRELKKAGDADAVAEAVAKLQALKINAAEMGKSLVSDEPEFNRKAFDELVLRKMFVVPSFEIHGGVKGLFDLGPPACSLKVRSDQSHRTPFNPIIRALSYMNFSLEGCHDRSVAQAFRTC